MTKNPILNALTAFFYILTLSLLMSWGTKNVSGPDTWLAPVVVISVFTLSAAVMGYVFGLRPITMFLDGKKKEAVKLFLQTVFYFGIITFVSAVLIFGRIVK